MLYLNSMRVHFLPLIVWLGTLAVVVALFSHRSHRYEIVGFAQGPIHRVAATCDGRLTALTVELFDEVKKGQVLAVLNSVPDNENPQDVIQAQTDTIVAEIDRLRAEWDATKERLLGAAAGMETDAVVNARRFALDVEDKNFRVQELDTRIRADKVELKRLKLDRQIFVVGGRLDANDMALYELKRLESDYDAAVKRIADNEALLALAREDLKRAEDRREAFAEQDIQDPEMTAASVLVDKSIEVQKKRMSELQVELAALAPVELKAPFDGVVSLVQHNPGEAILTGEPILTIAKREPDNIVAYATEEQAARVSRNMKVQLIDRNNIDKNMRRRTLMVESRVVYVGPTVEQMPARLWRNPNMPQWGRPILIEIPPNMKLVPGAMVGIKEI